MSAIARFGFENGYIPSNVTITMDNATGSVFAAGRNGGTCCEASNQPTGGTTVPNNASAYVKITFTPSNNLYFSCQLKVTQVNLSQSFTLFSFASITVNYNRSSNTIQFYNGATLIYTSPSTINFPLGTWIPVSGRMISSTSAGEVTINIDGTTYSISATNTGGTSSGTFYINLGCSKIFSWTYATVGQTYGPPKFQLDDVAVNDGYTATNSSGSFGVFDSTIPSFVSCRLVNYTSTGSNSVGWTCPDGDLISAVSSVSGGFITASFLPRPILELAPSQSISGVTTVEGINYYVGNSFREGSSNVYIIPHFMLNSTSSVQGQATFPLVTSPISASASVFEKDMGGKISFSEFMSGKIAIDSTQWINKNFFGRGTLGNVRYTASTNIGDGTVEYSVLEYNNLIIDAGAIITPSVSKKGLIIYVKENCIINGTISMVGKAPSGLSNLPNGFVFSKNVSSSEFSETGSILSPSLTLSVEQQFQPYLSSPTSSRFDINTVYATTGQSATSIGGCCGGGGPIFGIQALPSTSYGGGSGAAYNGPAGPGGGIIYLIVGKNLYVSSTGTISVNGGNAGNDAAGGGGGCLTILYGKNFINNGSLTSNGGAGANGGGSGSTGLIRVSSILSF